MAPEQFFIEGKTHNIELRNSTKDNIDDLLKIDVFTIGCIIYSILTNGKILFDYQTLMNAKEKNNNNMHLKTKLLDVPE